MGNRHSAVDSSGKSCGQKYCPQLFPELPTASLPCRLPTNSQSRLRLRKPLLPTCLVYFRLQLYRLPSNKLLAAAINFVCCGRGSVGDPAVNFWSRPTSFYIATRYFGHWAFFRNFGNFVPFIWRILKEFRGVK